MKTTVKNLAKFAASLNLTPDSKKREDVEKALDAHSANWKTEILEFLKDEDDDVKTLTHDNHITALQNDEEFQKDLASMPGATGWESTDKLQNGVTHYFVVGFDALTGRPVMRTKSVVKGKKRTTVQSTTVNGYFEEFEFEGANTHFNLKAVVDALQAGRLEPIESTDIINVKGDKAFSDYVDFSSKEARGVLLYRAGIQVTGEASTGAEGDYGKQVRFV